MGAGGKYAANGGKDKGKDKGNAEMPKKAKRYNPYEKKGENNIRNKSRFFHILIFDGFLPF